jgi:hypothetical protein
MAALLPVAGRLAPVVEPEACEKTPAAYAARAVVLSVLG